MNNLYRISAGLWGCAIDQRHRAQIDLQENLLKTLLVNLFTDSLRSVIPPELHSNGQAKVPGDQEQTPTTKC